MRTLSTIARVVLALALVASLIGCATMNQQGTTTPRTTQRDKTKRGAAIGAAAGAVLGAVVGKGDLENVLAGAAIGAGVGAGVGAYMDKQEEKLARIPGTTVERVEDNLLLVHFDSSLLFDVDSAVLTPGSFSSLDQAASVFAEYPKTAIIVQGHTDSTGSEEHNQALSERRAKAVMNELIGAGVDPSRMTSVGYGESYPVADNSTAAGRRQNRRVDLLLKAKVR